MAVTGTTLIELRLNTKELYGSTVNGKFYVKWPFKGAVNICTT
jgi:hypothetical protein